MGNKISKMVLQYAVFLVHLIYLSPSRVTQSGLRSKMPLYLSLDKKSTDRSDLVVRVFKLKMEQFMKGIMKGRTFGPVCAGSYSRHNSVMNNPIALEWLH